MSKVKQAVILAAGRGTRISPLSVYWPKPLLPVLNKPVIQYQIEAIAAAGIKDIVIVIGHLGEKIRESLGNGRRFGVSIKYIADKNPQGIASSLLLTKGMMKGSFLVFLGDIFIEDADLGAVVRNFEAKRADGIVAAKKERDFEVVKKNFAIVCNSVGKIIKVVEKPKEPVSFLKGYGLYIFKPGIFDAIKNTPKSSLRNEYEITDAIQTFISSGHDLYCQTWDRWDYNFSYPQDLLLCNLRLLRDRKMDFLVGERAKIDAGIQLSRSIIGDEAVVGFSGVFEECLVFPKTEVKKKTARMKRTIFTNEVVVSI